MINRNRQLAPCGYESELNLENNGYYSQPNWQPALSIEQVQEVKDLVNQVIDHELKNLSKDELIVWEMIEDGNILAQKIVSCDLPTDNKKAMLMVTLVQKNADEILNNQKLSWLMKILKIAIHSSEFTYGNCQEKAFIGFAFMLQNLTHNNQLQSLRLATFDNHFILIVNERFLMDPWLNLAFPLNKYNINQSINYVFKEFGALIDYFEFKSNNICISHQVTENAKTASDEKSQHDIVNCMQFLENNQIHLLQENQLKNNKKRKLSDSAENDKGSPSKKQKINDENLEVSNLQKEDAININYTIKDFFYPENEIKLTKDECDDFLNECEDQFDTKERDSSLFQQTSVLFQPPLKSNIQSAGSNPKSSDPNNMHTNLKYSS